MGTSNLEGAARSRRSALDNAKRPVIYAARVSASRSIRTCSQTTRRSVSRSRVGAWNSNDLLPSGHLVIRGARGRSLEIAPATSRFRRDYLLVLGSRVNIRLVSYNWENFARHAFKDRSRC
jgi:acetolactate synthase-1/2/3 large subunit